MKIRNEVLKAKIADKGMSVTEFAAKYGYKQQTVQAWVAGKRNPSPKNVHQLADNLGCDVSTLTDIKYLNQIYEEVKTSESNDISSAKILWEIYMCDEFSLEEKSKFANFIADYIKKQLPTKN